MAVILSTYGTIFFLFFLAPTWVFFLFWSVRQLSVQKKCLTFKLAATAGVVTKATLRFRPSLPMRKVLPGAVYTLREESTVQVQTCTETLVLKLVRSADAVDDADADADAEDDDADAGGVVDQVTRVTYIPVASVDRRLKAHHVRHDLTPWAWWG